jgi:hypothetical protein
VWVIVVWGLRHVLGWSEELVAEREVYRGVLEVVVLRTVAHNEVTVVYEPLKLKVE